ncbi:MAG TPA: hypothetical protein VK446_04845 [Methylocystis sp.]|nr:hypothetical protein [Methylocystis sp.]HXZ18143.1 hypothetical protein [Roseiarcus sp.]
MKKSLSEEIHRLARACALLTFSLIAGAVAAKLLYLDPGAFDRLFARTETVEIGDRRITLREFTFVGANLNLTEDDQRKIFEAGKRLAAWEFDRLLELPEYDESNIGDRDVICEFDRATSRMRLRIAADEGLIEKGLVKRLWRPDQTKAMQEEDARRPFVAGTPGHCRQILLTDIGRGLKSLAAAELRRDGGESVAQAIAPDVRESNEARLAPDAPARAKGQKSAALR